MGNSISQNRVQITDVSLILYENSIQNVFLFARMQNVTKWQSSCARLWPNGDTICVPQDRFDEFLSTLDCSLSTWRNKFGALPAEVFAR